MFNTIFKSDAAENSIMQTITIAVSAILIAAGLVTAPGLINNARDNNARTDAANLAYAQELYLAQNGSYAETIDDLVNFTPSGAGTHIAGTDDGISLSITLSGDVEHDMTVGVAGDEYLIAAESQSGNIFYRSSGSGLVSSDIADIDAHGLAIPTFDGEDGEEEEETPPSAIAAEITTNSLTAGEATVVYTATVVATGTGPITFSATGLPAGLSINEAGVISGTPTDAGTASVTVTATNSVNTDSKVLSLEIAAAPVVMLSSLTCTNTGSGSSRRVAFSWASAEHGGYIVEANNGGVWSAVTDATASVATGATVTGTLPSSANVLTWAAGTYPVRILDVAGNEVGTSSFRVAVNSLPSYRYLICV